MLRTFVHLFLLLCLCWQALAVAGQMPLEASHEELEHAVLHWSGQGHHHDDEGTLHQDESDQSTQHIVADGVVTSPALWPDSRFSFAAQVRAAPSAADEAVPLHPFVDKLRRPPRLNA